MKKWLLVIFILFAPMGLYAFLSNNSVIENNAPTAQVAVASSKPCVYKFASSMCMDCQKLESVLKVLKPRYEDKINFVFYNVDNPDKNVKKLIKNYNITLVPTMIFVGKDGRDKLKIEGYISEQELDKKLKALSNE